MPAKLPKPSGPVVLLWHRTDLRLHDAPALTAALELKPSVFIPVWTWDPHYVYRARVGPNRWRFLLECQQDLSAAYTKLNPKQKLWLVREAPQTVFPKLWKTWGVTHLVFEKDTDAYARDRDNEVVRLAEKAGVTVVIRSGRTLFDSDEIVRVHDRKPTMSITQLEKAAEKLNGGVPDRPLDPPSSVPDPWDENRMDLSRLIQDIPEAEPDVNSEHRTKKSETQYQNIMGPKRDFAVPTLKELGIDPAQATTPHRGGESVALGILGDCIRDEEYVGTFEKPKTSPAAFEPQATTLLSPHLHFGSLSVRKFWWDVDAVLKKRKTEKRPVAQLPTNLPGQLLFRDMYFAAQAALGYAYAQTQGNRIARFVPWHLQSNYSEVPRGEHLLDGTYTIDKPEAETWFRRWKHGRTGFPWIDALMRQLKQEGWIHHLGRHSVACFLTRGGCYVSWERGAEVFEEWLVDHETASNVGNWMWLSCTAFFSQYYRCYSPVAFGKKWDPEGHFVRRYCPELAQFDKKYIYEPWKAPIADQKKWQCRVTGDGSASRDEASGLPAYPKPMFNFDERRDFCISQIKHAYEVNFYGDDAKVMDGSWKEVFDFHDEGGKVVDETTGQDAKQLTGGIRKRSGGDEELDGDNTHGLDGAKEEEPSPKRKR
ncbi:deoxyribodipyrimidine photo-lyase [Aspergillus homomorphus CBS 101889]|uniref:DNA photolyase n=1 Tax=Aspergillus homomorphus (strain CBS 101889) TaxID=1450537 RepID=A0A395I162_ASPHC|nr:DNA photolyase [Aspergillus homomorphus CBS 101889]RAL13932.1 DNA photolyase [Aspergillus homomorphus CBS 101889]